MYSQEPNDVDYDSFFQYHIPLRVISWIFFLFGRSKNLGTFWRKLYLPAHSFMFMDMVPNAKLKSSYIYSYSSYFFKVFINLMSQ